MINGYTQFVPLRQSCLADRDISGNVNIKAEGMPGMQWIIIAFYAGFFTAIRPILIYWGFPLQIRTINYLGTGVTFSLLSFGIYRYVVKEKISDLYTREYLLKLKAWFIIVFVMFAYGFYLKNTFLTITTDFILYFYMGMFLLIGGDDRFWRIIIKHLTILFYAAVVLMFFFINVSMIPYKDESYNYRQLYMMDDRYTMSVSYYLRPLISSGLLIGMWGLVHGDKKWRFMQVLTWAFYFAYEVGFFQFRAGFIFITMAIFSFLLLRPLLEKRSRVNFTYVFIVLFLLSFAYYTTTEYWSNFSERFDLNQKVTGIFSGRFEELDAYITDLGWKVVVGRGMGGTFDASTVSWTSGAYVWSTLHFGILIYTLKGGVLFLFLFLSIFFMPLIKRRKSCWYHEPYNLAAILIFPVYFVQYLINPIFAGPESIFFHLPIMMVLSRFGKRD
jgi:hypothetical protein